MSNLLILYHSEHHLNTKKLLESAAAQFPVDLADISEAGTLFLDRYKAVGFASGVYFSRLHPSLSAFLHTSAGEIPCKKSFVLYTCGSGGKKYAEEFLSELSAAGFQTLGTFHCKGFDTYGPFRLIGGVAKKHPDQVDVSAAVNFLRDVSSML